MSKFKYYLILCLGIFACQSKNTEDNNNPNQTNIQADTAQETKQRGDELPPNRLVQTEFSHHAWYEGQLDNIPVWLYFEGYNLEYLTGYYGYDRHRGSLKISGKKQGNKIQIEHLNYFGGKDYKERFDLEFQSADGSLKGSWTNGTKKAQVQFTPLNATLKNAQDLVDFAENLPLPWSCNYAFGGISPEDKIPDLAKNRRFNRYIPNLNTLLGEQIRDINSSEKLDLGPSGVLIGKVKLNQGALVFFSVDVEGTGGLLNDMESAKGALALAFIENGQIKDACILGNDGEDSYFLDLQWDIIKADGRFKISRYEFMRAGGARMMAGGTAYHYVLKNGKISLEKEERLEEETSEDF